MVATPVAASGDALTIDQAEAEILRLINVDRTNAGLVAVRRDSRISAIARARSVDMVTKDYFSHIQPDGRNAFDMINAARISWYTAGEIIAWNNYPTLATSAGSANEGWLNSPPHKDIIMSSNFNYVGVGLAVQEATGKKYWTAVFLKGPDRTGAWARMGTTSIGVRSAGKRMIRVRWSGGDVRLSILTAGLSSYQVQRRIDGGSWRTIATTTSSYVRRSLSVGHRYQFRVRAIDRRGNRGSWTIVKTIRI
jgi:hypothetical protein